MNALSQQLLAAQAEQEEAKPRSYLEVGLGKQFRNTVYDRQECKLKADMENEAKDVLSDELAFGMAKADVKVVLCERYRVNLIDDATSSTLSKEKLLELGVTADIIAAATITKPKAPYVQVTDIEKGKVLRREKKAGVKSIAKAKSKVKSKPKPKRTLN